MLTSLHKFKDKFPERCVCVCVCACARAPIDSHTRTFSFPLVHDGYDACVLVLHLLFVMVDRLAAG